MDIDILLESEMVKAICEKFGIDINKNKEKRED